MLIHVYIDKDTRCGTVAAASDGVIAGNAAETLSLRYRGTDEPVPAGTSVALLSQPYGTTLAHGIVEGAEGLCALNTATKECVEYLSTAPCGATYPAALAVGDANSLVALIGARVLRNWLAGIAPPAESAPIYPTDAALRATLADFAETEKRLTATAGKTEEQLFGISEQVQQATQILTDIGEAKADALSGISDAATAADQAVEAAKTEALQAVTEARAQTSEAITAIGTEAAKKVTDTQTAALQAVGTAQTAAEAAVGTAGTEAVNTVNAAGAAISKKIAEVGPAIDAKVDAAASSAGAAGQAAARAETAADRAEHALALVPVIADEAAATLEAARTLTGTEDTPVSPLLYMAEKL